MTRPPYDDPDHRPEPLAALRRDPMPPPGLEDRVVRTLAGRGMLHRDLGTARPGRARRWFTAVAAVAASLLIFMLGFAMGSPAATTDTRPAFMLLLYEDASFRGPPVGQEMAYFNEYSAWADTLRSRGYEVSGAELAAAAHLLEPGAEAPLATSDDPPGAGTLPGYFLLRAASAESALAVAATAPHLRHGGRIVVRPLGEG
mgnify:CR=1 FL=1